MSKSSERSSSGGLRRRLPASDDSIATATFENGASKESAFAKGSTSAKRGEPFAAPKSGGNRRGPLLLALLFAFGISFVFRSRYSALPKAYALCSKEGNIYTVDIAVPQAECIVIHKSRILSVGTLDETRKRFGDADTTGPASRSLAANFKAFKNGIRFYYIKPGHAIVPGLADSHAHLLSQGFMMNLNVFNTSSVEEVIEKVKAYVRARPDVLNDRTIWIEGMGWDHTKWPEAKFPTAAAFDKDPLLRGRPIVLDRVDGHAIWVSTRVLEQISNFPDSVEGGSIIRDDDGNPTGIFVDNAMSLVKPPAWSEKKMFEFYSTAVFEAISYGLTSIHDAKAKPSAISFFKKVADAGELPLRLYLMRYIEPSDYQREQFEQFINYGTTGRLTLRSVKLMSDGALGSWGAALLQPYSDKPEEQGTLLTSPKALSELIRRFWNDGLQVNVHCIGDRANNVVLDIFEELLRNTSSAVQRPRIEHAQIMTPSDLERAGRLGVITSVQPTHATSDMWYAETRLGPERIKSAYAYKTLLRNSDAGVLPLGSDFPVEGVNPLLGFYAAVMRLSESGDSPHGIDGWFPEERLTREEALRGMTIDAAYASFTERELGSLTPGKRADFVVFDTNIMTVPHSQILHAKVVATVVDGRPVFGGFIS